MPDENAATIAERVQLDIESRFNPTGVNQAVRKLEALDSAIKSINNRLAGLDASAAFPRTQASVRDLITRLQGEGATNLRSVSRVLGFDPAAVEAAYDRHLENLRSTVRRTQGNAQTEAVRQFNAARRIFQGPSLRVDSAEAAAQFFSQFQRQAVTTSRDVWRTMRDMFSAPAAAAAAPAAPGVVPPVEVTPPPPPLAAREPTLAAGPIPIIIPADRIVATLGPGVIPLIVQTAQVAGQPTAPVHAPTPSVAPVAPTAAPVPTAAAAQYFPVLQGHVISRETIERPGEKAQIKERLITEIDGVNREVTQYLKEVEGTIHGVRQVFHEHETRATGLETGVSPAQSAAARRRIALLRNTENLEQRQQEEAAAVSIENAKRANRAARVNRQRREERGTLDTRINALPPAEQSRIRNLRLPNDLMERQIQAAEEVVRAEAEAFRANEAAMRNLSPRFRRSVATRRRVGVPERLITPMIEAQTAATSSSIEAARRANQAADIRRERQEQRTQLEGRISALPPTEQGRIRAMGLSYDALAREIRNTEHALAALGRTNGASSRDFIRNTIHVSTWAASVGTLYGALGLLKYGLESVISVGGQMQRLDQIFSKVGASSEQLTDRVLQLAAANGRASDEAMESGIQWSRLGGTAAQVGTLVRSSLLEANVAQISSAEATEHLSATMQAYGLSVGGVVSLVGELNAVSNTYNVTNKDLLGGLSRTAILAKQASLPLHELIGLIGGTVGATGQSGANIGNAIKSTIAAVSNPALQEKLRDQFHFEVTTKGGGELQTLSEIIGNLFVHYQELTDVEQKHLVVEIAGKTQANRLTAVLDSYVQSMVLAYRAAGNLNTAEIENAKIKASLKSQLQGLSAEFIRFANIQSSQGVGVGNRWTFSINAGLRDATEGLKHFGEILNAPGVRTGTTILIGLMAALTARMAIMSVTARTAAVSGGAAASGIINNTIAAFTAIQTGMGRTISNLMLNFQRTSATGGGFSRFFGSIVTGAETAGNRIRLFGGEVRDGTRGLTAMASATGLVGTAGRGLSGLLGGLIAGFGSVTRVLASSLAALRGFLPVLAVVGAAWAGLKVINSGMESLGLSIEHTTEELAGWNEKAEQAAANAEKFVTAARLFRTVGQSLPNLPAERQDRTIKALASITYLDEEPGKREARQKELTERMRSGLRGSKADFAGFMEQFAAESVHQSSLASQQAFSERLRAAEETEKKIAALQGKLKSPFTQLYGGSEKIQQNIDELEKQKLQSQSAALHILSDENDELAHTFEGNVKILGALESQKGVLQSISDIYGELPTRSPLSKTIAEKNQLEEQLRFLANEKTRLNAQADSLRKNDQGTANEAKRLSANKAALQQDLDAVNTRLHQRSPEAERLADLTERRANFTDPNDRKIIDEQISATRKLVEAQSEQEKQRLNRGNPRSGLERQAADLRTGIAEIEAQERAFQSKSRRQELVGGGQSGATAFSLNRLAETKSRLQGELKDVEARLQRTAPGADDSISRDLYQRKQLLTEIADIEKKLKELPGEQSLEHQKLNQELGQRFEEEKKLRAEMEKTNAMIEQRRKQSIVQTTVERARFEVEPSKVGYGEGEKLLNEQQAINDLLRAQTSERERLNRITNRSAEEQDSFLSASARINTLLSEQQQNLLSIERAKADALREQRQLMIDMNREAQRSLLLAKPGDLLKAMAAYQLTGGGRQGRMTGGQFLAMAPETREWANRFDPTFDPRMMELRRTSRLLGPALPDKEFNQRFNDASMKQVPLGVEPQFNAAAKAATEFATAVNLAGTSLTEFGTMLRGVMDTLSDMVHPGHDRGTPMPSQMNGRGGADGPVIR